MVRYLIKFRSDDKKNVEILDRTDRDIFSPQMTLAENHAGKQIKHSLI